MEFKITGLPMAEFAEILRLGRADLRAAGITSCIVDERHAYPCRITLEDAMPGEEVLLLSYAHQRTGTPYDSSGPIFINRSATATASVSNAVPDQQRRRLLSVRAYDARHAMVDAEVAPGAELESLIGRFFADPSVSYLHVHNARRGCYACRVDRL
jgi:Protein of unknown function (DUF1203)